MKEGNSRGPFLGRGGGVCLDLNSVPRCNLLSERKRKGTSLKRGIGDRATHGEPQEKGGEGNKSKFTPTSMKGGAISSSGGKRRGLWNRIGRKEKIISGGVKSLSQKEIKGGY